MKKLLLILLIVALGFLTYNTITSGVKVYGLNIPSYKELQNDNNNLDNKISELDTLIDVTYANKVNDVAKSKTDFNKKKQAYESILIHRLELIRLIFYPFCYPYQIQCFVQFYVVSVQQLC